MDVRQTPGRYTFDARHLRAPGPAVERELGGDRVQHLHKVWQEEDDLHLVVGQVASTADALRPLDVGTAQQGHGGTLVHVLGREPAGRTPKTNCLPVFSRRSQGQLLPRGLRICHVVNAIRFRASCVFYSDSQYFCALRV